MSRNATSEFASVQECSTLGQLRTAQLISIAVLLAASFFIHCAASAASYESDRGGEKANGPQIRVAQGDWGSAGTTDIQRVLEAVADELGSHFPGRRLSTIQVVRVDGNPMVLYERGAEGEYIVQLSARDGRWYQFAYQFSHELCHIYSNFDNKATRDGQHVSDNQWFEEAVCEAAALFTLRRMAVTWETSPPDAKWKGYASTFRDYAEHFLGEGHRHLPPTTRPSEWYLENRDLLRNDPYLRDKDEVVANLLLPLFEQSPDNWQAIGYLNLEESAAVKGFREFLSAWCSSCPERQRAFVRQIMAMFGLEPDANVADSR